MASNKLALILILVYVQAQVCIANEAITIKSSRAASSSDALFARDVLRTVQTTLDTVGDFSSLNKNYAENYQLLEEMNTFFIAQEVPSLAFELKAADEWNRSTINSHTLAVQINLGVFDFESNTTWTTDNMQVTRTKDAFGLEYLQVEIAALEITVKCLAFSINVVKVKQVSTCSLQFVYLRVFNEEADKQLLQQIEKQIDCTVFLHNAVQLDSSWLRMYIDGSDPALQPKTLSSEQVEVLRKDAEDWLFYSGASFVYRFAYALLDMNREQLLSSDTVDTQLHNDVATNIMLLNRQLFEVQKRIAQLPTIWDLAPNDLVANTEEVRVDSLDVEDTLPQLDILLRRGDEPVASDTKKGVFTPGRQLDDLQIPVKLGVSVGVTLVGSLVLNCDWLHNQTHFEYINFNYQKLWHLDAQLECNLRFAPTALMLFTSTVDMPYDVDRSADLVFSLRSGDWRQRVRFTNPVRTAFEEAGHVFHGLKFEQSTYSGNTKFSFHREWRIEHGKRRKECHRNCYIVLDGAKTAYYENDVDADVLRSFRTFPTPLHQVAFTSTKMKWNDDQHYKGKALLHSFATRPFTATFEARECTRVNLIARVPIDAQVFGPASFESNSFNFLLLQLNSLAEQVQQIEERVVALEDVVYQNNHDFWWFVSNSFSMVDMAFNVVELTKAGTAVVRSARNTMKKKTRADRKPLAHQFALKQQESRQANSYSVLSAVDAAAQVNLLQGHRKHSYYEPRAAHLDIADLDVHAVVKNKRDLRDIMELNSACYAHIQSTMYASLAINHRDFARQPFGRVAVHKSPIDVPVAKPAMKFISDHYKTTQSGRAFLANDHQRFPFHTSVSSNSVEIRKDGVFVLNTRFSGVAEPSVVGPTNAKNPRVKVGYVKIQHKLEVQSDGSSTLQLLPWHETQITPGVFYTKQDVDQLFASFYSKRSHNAALSTDEKWELVVHKTAKRINSRNTIDSVPLQSNIYLNTLDDMMFFSKNGGNFKYNLLNNNCQTYARAFAQLASSGNTHLDLVASDFRSFAQQVAEMAQQYFAGSPTMALPASVATAVRALAFFIADFTGNATIAGDLV